MTLFARLLLGLATLAAALVAGFFYAYSVSVMPGFAAADPLVSIRAMQAINAVVRNPLFAFSFFGTLGFGLAAAALLLASRRPSGWAALAGAALYGLGAFAVTFLFSVPLNQDLAALTPAPETARAIWTRYALPWTWWNDVRTIASVGALAMLVMAVAIEARTR